MEPCAETGRAFRRRGRKLQGVDPRRGTRTGRCTFGAPARRRREMRSEGSRVGTATHGRRRLGPCRCPHRRRAGPRPAVHRGHGALRRAAADRGRGRVVLPYSSRPQYFTVPAGVTRLRAEWRVRTAARSHRALRGRPRGAARSGTLTGRPAGEPRHMAASRSARTASLVALTLAARAGGAPAQAARGPLTLADAARQMRTTEASLRGPAGSRAKRWPASSPPPSASGPSALQAWCAPSAIRG